MPKASKYPRYSLTAPSVFSGSGKFKARWIEENKPGKGATELHQFVWSRLEANHWYLFQPKPGSTWKDYAPDLLADAGRQAIRHLLELHSEGSGVCLERLVDLACEATRPLSALAESQPTMLQPVARKRFFWPFLKCKSDRERYSDQHKQIAKAIQLGADCHTSHGLATRVSKGNKIDKDSTRLALALIEDLEAWRTELQMSYRFGISSREREIEAALEKLSGVMGSPGRLQSSDKERSRLNRIHSEWPEVARGLHTLADFGPLSWTDWFRISWAKVELETMGHPEKSPSFHVIGKYRKNHSQTKGPQTVVPDQTAASDIRDGIKRDLKTTFRRLAGVPGKFSKKAG